MKKNDYLIERCDPKLKEDFRKYVISKHGSLHGFMRKEFDNAIRSYMDNNPLHPCTNLSNISKTRNIRLNHILAFLHDYNEIDRKSLIEFIEKHIGSNKRTVNAYLPLLYKHRYLTVLVTKHDNVIYSVNKKLVSKTLEV